MSENPHVIKIKMASHAKKHCVMEKFVTDYTSLWSILKPIEGPENIMLEVEVKLSAMPLGGRNRVLYKEIRIEAFCEFILLHILQHLWRNMRHSGKCLQIPETCLSYS